MMGVLTFCLFSLFSCKGKSDAGQTTTAGEVQLQRVLDRYFDQRMALFPIEATNNGISQYNGTLYAEFTDGHRAKVKSLYEQTLASIDSIDRESLGEQGKISYDFMKSYHALLLDELKYPFNQLPTDQMFGPHLVFGQFASGSSSQPFQTEADYQNWLMRMGGIERWIDSAIVYFRKGMRTGIVHPRALVVKMIPQFEAMAGPDLESHLYYTPVNMMPASFSAEAKSAITSAYAREIRDKIMPAHRRMADFLKNEYLPKARSTSGYGDFPGGKEFYLTRVKLSTTTDKSPDEIYQLGLSEVARIRAEMEKVKAQVGFQGDLKAFFAHVNRDPKMTPFASPEEVLNAFRKIHTTMMPQLKKEFDVEPKTPFEIRQTEAFRAASASAEYNPSPDNKKAGIFYVPILNAKAFNITSGMESLFLHEAIPGHHYQVSLQRENTQLPMIRRYDPWSNAYVEGWALYCESLGKQLGLYTDPYQYLGALGDEMHRAIRLVVDVGLHAKGMSREEAIRYMMDNEQISEQGATAEIERYMSGPGQALGYKIGALKIRELRTKYEKQLGSKFSPAAFHAAFLADGSMPLTTMEAKMDRWAATQK
jgi:uncharacterized protein (DUF885 family)